MTGLVGRLRRDPPTVPCPSCGHDNVGAAVRWCGWCGHALEEARPTVTASPSIERRRRAPAVLAVAGLALVGLVIASTIRSTPDTPRGLTARGDAHRTGQVAVGDVRAPAEVAWSAALEVQPTAAAVDRSIAVGNGLVVTARGTRLIALDASSGLVRWVHDLGGGVAEVRGVAVLADAVAVAVSPAGPGGDAVDNVLGTIVLSASDGSRVRSTSRVASAYPLRLPTAQPIMAVDDLLVDTDSRMVRAMRVDGDTASVAWELDVTTALDASMVGLVTATPTTIVAIGSRPAGIVLQSNVAAGDALLIGIDARDGAISWTRPFPADMPFTPIGTDGVAVVAADGASLAVVDIRSGVILQELSRPDSVTGTALSANRLVVTTESGVVVGSDRATRQTLWAVPAPRSLGAGLRVEALPDGAFLVHDRSQDGEAWVFGGDAGEVLAIVQLGARAVTSGAADLLVADDGDGIVALDMAGATRWRADLPQPPVVGMATDGTNVTVQAPDETAILDGRTGERLASIRRGFGRFPADRQGGPVVTDGTTTVLSPLSFDGARTGLVAIDALTGVNRWDREGDAPTAEGPLTLAGERVWMPVADEVHGYTLVDGRRAYAARAGVPRGPLAITEELIVAPAARGDVGSASGAPAPGNLDITIADQAAAPHSEPDLRAPLVALGRASRRPVWSADTGGCGVVSVRDGLVYAPTPQGVVARELEGGSVRWAQEAADGSCTPLTVAQGVVVHARGRQLTALDADDGEVRWTADLARATTTVPVAVGDVVVVADATGLLQALALDDGAPRWQFGLPAPAAAPPVVVAGRLIVLLSDGRLVALR